MQEQGKKSEWTEETVRKAFEKNICLVKTEEIFWMMRIKSARDFARMFMDAVALKKTLPSIFDDERTGRLFFLIGDQAVYYEEY